MMMFFKRLASWLPLTILLEIKRIYHVWQVRHTDFSAGEPEYGLLSSWLQDGDWVIDVGANIGQYTKKMSDLVGSSGRVIAFEPMRETFYLLGSNVNKFEYKSNVSLFNTALSDKTEVLGMELPKLDSGLDNYYQAHLAKVDSGRSVLCITIDSLNLPEKIKLVKIDAEGHELPVIIGMEKIIERDYPVLIVENHGDEVERFLKKYGYSKKKLERSPNIIFFKQ